MNEQKHIEVLEDLIISCGNHKRGTLSTDTKELERFYDREKALSYAIECIKLKDRVDEGKIKDLLEKPFIQGKVKMWVIARDKELIAKAICKYLGGGEDERARIV